MSTRAATYTAEVIERAQVSDYLIRVVMRAEGFVSTGVPDEWVGLMVPGQFQSRYYTVRSIDGALVTLDIVVHETGLVTEWASRPGIVGDRVQLTAPKGSFAPPAEAEWLYLVGDATALPAMARITQSCDPGLNVQVWAEVPEPVEGYFPAGLATGGGLTWLEPPPGGSGLATWVETLPWPAGQGYFWMAGESSQMRAIRKHLMRERALPPQAYDVMGYWRAGAVRQPRAVDPGPAWRAGQAEGKSEAEIWQSYDEAAQRWHDGE